MQSWRVTPIEFEDSIEFVPENGAWRPWGLRKARLRTPTDEFERSFYSAIVLPACISEQIVAFPWPGGFLWSLKLRSPNFLFPRGLGFCLFLKFQVFGVSA